jgi:hypothetical protein
MKVVTKCWQRRCKAFKRGTTEKRETATKLIWIPSGKARKDVIMLMNSLKFLR